jgi:hypothetical protein
MRLLIRLLGLCLVWLLGSAVHFGLPLVVDHQYLLLLLYPG